MSKLQLIPITQSHAEILAALHTSGFPEPWPAEAFAKLLTNPHRTGVVALEGDIPAGFVMIQQTPDEAEILTLVVEPSYRRRGLGKKLMTWAIEAAAQGGARRLVLEVSEVNWAARKLYDSLDFAEIGQRSGYYRRAEGVETAHILARSVVRGGTSH